tara:strand:- start:647 stop:1552 length:906 start_codon:yes stop_codon:yes gene_type:complete
MAYGKIKADTLVYDNGGTDTDVTIASLGNKADTASPTFTGTINAAALTLSGDLTVQGTTTTISSSTIEVTDKNIELGKVGTPTDSTATGGGITLKGATDKTFNWETTTAAWTSSEHIAAGDGKKVLLGDSQDFQIYHDGHSNIDGSSGSLYIRAKAGETSILCAPDAQVNLYYDASKKLETTSAGVTVTGSVTDDKGNVRSIPAKDQGGASEYTLIASDAGKTILRYGGGLTIPNSVMSTGDAVTIINASGSDITLTQGSGMTLYNTADASTGNRTLAGRGMATIWFPGSSSGYISGAGLS